MRFAQHMLTKEQQEAPSIIVDRSAMLLNHTNTLNNIGQSKLFATGQKRYPLGSQEFLEIGRDFFGDSFGFAIIREVGVRRVYLFPRCSHLSLLGLVASC